TCREVCRVAVVQVRSSWQRSISLKCRSSEASKKISVTISTISPALMPRECHSQPTTCRLVPEVERKKPRRGEYGGAPGGNLVGHREQRCSQHPVNDRLRPRRAPPHRV